MGFMKKGGFNRWPQHLNHRGVYGTMTHGVDAEVNATIESFFGTRKAESFHLAEPHRRL